MTFSTAVVWRNRIFEAEWRTL